MLKEPLNTENSAFKRKRSVTSPKVTISDSDSVKKTRHDKEHESYTLLLKSITIINCK